MYLTNKIYFRTDSSSEMGIGHVMRCLALADGLSKKGWICTFLCKDHVGSAKTIIENKGYLLELLAVDEFIERKGEYEKWVGSTQDDDAKACLRLIGRHQNCVVVVDHYGLDSVWESKIKPEVDYLIVIDDLVNRPHRCDVLIDSKYGRIEEEYRKFCNKSTIILTGTNYCLLRKEFFGLIPEAKKKRGDTRNINKILINFGGSDSQGYSVKVLRILNKYFDHLNIEIIIGSSCRHINELKRNITSKTNLYVDANNVASIMLECDFSIGSFGGMSWERCSLGLPSFGFIAADNQNEIAQSLSDKGVVGILDENNFESKLIDILSGGSDIGWWKDMSKKSFMLCDGKGVLRIISVIEGLY
jgi:UDP-2,4-diacetamido-2,4,6-trideoxy-beta-L-altropyranose hydrolase